MKTLLQFLNGPTIEADVLKKTQRFAVHKSLNSKRGYVITDIASLKCVTWCPTQQAAKALRREIEDLPLIHVARYLRQ